MKKKICLLFILLIGLFLIPTVARAAEEEPSLTITVGEEEYDVLGGEVPDHVTYDEDTNTLTLDGFEGTAIFARNMDLKLVLKGENSFTDSHDGAIEVDGDLTISGDGILNVTLDNNSAICVQGNLTLNGGEYNITGGLDAGFYVFGTFTVNSGSINISNSGMGIIVFATEEDDGVFIGNGGEINISDTNLGFLVADSMTIDGVAVTLDNVGFGINAESIKEVVLNSGKLIFKNPPEGGGMAFAVGCDEDTEKLEDVIKFNRDNLYIDNPDYDFRIMIVQSSPYIVIGPEDVYYNSDVDYNVAREVSILPKTKYEVTEGDGQKISQSAKAIKIDADLDKFVALYINDELVDEENYDLESGSTIIKLKDSYVKKLEAGNYKFKAVFTDGIAEGEFTVTTDNPETGDSAIFYIIIFIVSITTLAIIKQTLKNEFVLNN